MGEANLRAALGEGGGGENNQSKQFFFGEGGAGAALVPSVPLGFAPGVMKWLDPRNQETPGLAIPSPVEMARPQVTSPSAISQGSELQVPNDRNLTGNGQTPGVENAGSPHFIPPALTQTQLPTTHIHTQAHADTRTHTIERPCWG